MRSGAGTLALSLSLASGLLAQTGLPTAVAKWKGKAPGFSLSLELADKPKAFEGQLILLRLQHRSPYEQRFGMPLPPFRYQFAGFLLHPAPDECDWLERPCFRIDMLTASKFDNLIRMDFHQQPVESDLNTYTPLLPPGKYRVAAVMRRQELSQSFGRVGFGYAQPEQYLVSNAVAVEVRPARREEQQHLIESATQTLLAAARGEGEQPMRDRAARQIAAINLPEAHVAALALFGRTKNRQLLQGLFRDLAPQAACELMKSRLEAPEQTLHFDYAYVTSYWCTRAAVVKNHQAEVMGQVMSVIAERAADPAQADSRALRAAVLQYGAQLLANFGGSGEAPDFVRETVAHVARELPGYPAAEVFSALSQHWPLLREAVVRPALERIVATNTNSRVWVDARRMAIVRLQELDPNRGREVLIDELRHFRPTLDGKVMDLLPASAGPEIDEALLTYLSRGRQGSVAPGADASLLIARYLSPRAAPRVKEVIEAQPSACRPGLLAYFVRVEPSYADRWLRRTPMGHAQAR